MAQTVVLSTFLYYPSLAPVKWDGGLFIIFTESFLHPPHPESWLVSSPLTISFNDILLWISLYLFWLWKFIRQLGLGFVQETNPGGWFLSFSCGQAYWRWYWGTDFKQVGKEIWCCSGRQWLYNEDQEIFGSSMNTVPKITSETRAGLGLIEKAMPLNFKTILWRTPKQSSF